MSSTSENDAVKLVTEVFSVVSTTKDDGGLPDRGLVHAALWAFVHSPFVEAVRATPPARGRLAELAELDPCARALVTSSENGGTALAVDLKDVRPGRDGRPSLTGQRDVDPPPPEEDGT